MASHCGSQKHPAGEREGSGTDAEAAAVFQASETWRQLRCCKPARPRSIETSSDFVSAVALEVWSA